MINWAVGKINEVEAFVAPDGYSLLPAGPSSHGTTPKGKKKLGCLHKPMATQKHVGDRRRAFTGSQLLYEECRVHTPLLSPTHLARAAPACLPVSSRRLSIMGGRISGATEHEKVLGSVGRSLRLGSEAQNHPQAALFCLL